MDSRLHGRRQDFGRLRFAGPLTETVILGVLSSRFPGKRIEWDAENFKVTNLPEANRFIRRRYGQEDGG